MRTLATFVELARPKFLFGGFAGFALGAAVAAYEGTRIDPLRYVVGQFMVTAFQLMTHFANDYFDRDGDRHGTPTEFAGGSGVLARGALRPRDALRAAVSSGIAGMVVAAAFFGAGLPIAAVLGLAMGLGAWAYSAPPVRLTARGWGEADAALVVGVLVPLAGYSVFAAGLDGLALAATGGPACGMLVLMLAVAWPDRDVDARTGKANLVVRLGTLRAGRIVGAAALLIVPALLFAILRGAPRVGTVFALMLVPAVAGFVRVLNARAPDDQEIAARGVGLFVLTAIFELLSYLTALI